MFDDLDRLVIHEPTVSSKVYRQGLDRDEAKALSVIQQKWPKLSRQDIIVYLLKIIQRHPADQPRTIANVHDPATRTVLDFLERVLLRVSSRMALSGMRLLEVPAAILDMEAITTWYLSFGPIFSPSSSLPPSFSLSDQTRDTLIGVKFLDLSGNNLKEIPPRLPAIFPGLQKLDLSGNPLGCLPASSPEWVELTRLKLDPPMRLRTSRARLDRILAGAWEPPTLVESCLSRLIESLRPAGSPAVPDPRRPLPAHLSHALAKGRLCDHCRRFRWPAQKALYLPARFHFLVRGFNRHISILLGPSFLCPACLALHYTHSHSTNYVDPLDRVGFC